MENKNNYEEFINIRALETFKDLIGRYERGEILSFSISINDCELTLKPLWVNDEK